MYDKSSFKDNHMYNYATAICATQMNEKTQWLKSFLRLKNKEGWFNI